MPDDQPDEWITAVNMDGSNGPEWYNPMELIPHAIIITNFSLMPMSWNMHQVDEHGAINVPTTGFALIVHGKKAYDAPEEPGEEFTKAFALTWYGAFTLAHSLMENLPPQMKHAVMGALLQQNLRLVSSEGRNKLMNDFHDVIENAANEFKWGEE